MKPLKQALVPLLLSISTVVFIEGGASWFLFLKKCFDRAIPASSERVHTEHDPELGWINIPSVHIPNLYGPGVSLTTNSLRLRSTSTLPNMPNERPRIVCSGDSFTLGYGVADDQTWCHYLSEGGEFNTFNMGQGGYGLDQIYLWYKRDGQKLNPSVHIVALTLQDLLRMQSSSFLGYPKPQVILQGSTLVTAGTPLPPPDLGVSRFWILHQAAADLRLSQLLRRSPPLEENSQLNYSELSRTTIETAKEILKEIKRINKAHHTRTIFVLIPLKEDLNSPSVSPIADELFHTCKDLSIPVLDLISEMKHDKKSEIASYFIPQGAIDYPGAAGHFTENGNSWVASHIRPLIR